MAFWSGSSVKLSPLLWSVAYNIVLVLSQRKEANKIVYVDNLGGVVVAKQPGNVEV